MIHLTRIYSNNIRMSFGLDMCGQIVSRREKIVTTERADLVEGNIADLQDSYKYLQIAS